MRRATSSIRNTHRDDWSAILAYDISVPFQEAPHTPSVSLCDLPEALQISANGTCRKGMSQGPAISRLLTAAPNVVQDPMDSGEARLKALGYKQELKRDFTLVSNTAISFSIISTLLGITGICRPLSAIHAASFPQYSHSNSYFNKGCATPPDGLEPLTPDMTGCAGHNAGSLPVAYNNGGAPTAVWGWILCCSMTMSVVIHT